jgi:hypothetical protein
MARGAVETGFLVAWRGAAPAGAVTGRRQSAFPAPLPQPVQELFGQSSLETAAKYMHSGIRTKMAAAQKLAGILGSADGPEAARRRPARTRRGRAEISPQAPSRDPGTPFKNCPPIVEQVQCTGTVCSSAPSRPRRCRFLLGRPTLPAPSARPWQGARDGRGRPFRLLAARNSWPPRLWCRGQWRFGARQADASSHSLRRPTPPCQRSQMS